MYAHNYILGIIRNRFKYINFRFFTRIPVPQRIQRVLELRYVQQRALQH